MAKDTILDWDADAAARDGIPPERHLGRYAVGGLAGASIALIIVALHVWFFHRTLLAAGANHVVTSGLEVVVTPEDLQIIDEEFDRAAAWYVDGQLELPSLVRAMQVVMAADILAYAATQTLRDSMSAWPGVDAAEVDLLSRSVGGGILARSVAPKQLAEALGSACRRSGPGEPLDADGSWSQSFLLYGDRLQLAKNLSNSEAHEAMDALRAFLEAQAFDASPLRGDLRSHLRERLDGEVGWRLDP
ncbi:MAG: hypothetical protein AAFV77_07325 [Planctomycetota bacterium]